MLQRFFERGSVSPWRELSSLQDEINRVFSEGSWSRRQSNTDYPALNVWSGEDKLFLTAELPGVNPDEIDISVQGNSITLKGSRKSEELKENETYHRQERAFGQFVRTFELPHAIDPEKVQATYNKGILSITLARPEADKPKKIAVK